MQEANTYLRLILEDNENLTNNFVVYNNLMIKIKFKYENKDKDNLDLIEAEKQSLEYYIAQFRSYATRIKIKFNSIKDKMNITQEQSQSFFESYKKINNIPLPEPELCEEFVQITNDILAEKISAYEAMLSEEQKNDYTESAIAPNIEDE